MNILNSILFTELKDFNRRECSVHVVLYSVVFVMSSCTRWLQGGRSSVAEHCMVAITRLPGFDSQRLPRFFSSAKKSLLESRWGDGICGALVQFGCYQHSVIGIRPHAPCNKALRTFMYMFNTAPLFHCPCGKCSLATYLKDGCPQSNYPFLQLSKLDEDDREDLTQQLDHETKKIIDSFLELVDSTVESLRARNVTPLQLARRALELKAYDGTSAMMQQPLMHDEEKKLKDSNSIDGSFIVLQPHMSFFNYEPLEHIIKGIQTGSDEDRRRMEDYSKKFEQYCKRRLFEVYPTAIGQSITDSKGNVRKTFVVVTFREEPLYKLISLNDAKKMTKKIASLLGLKSSTLFLHRVDEGSLMLVFSVPAFVAKDIFPLKPAVAATLKSNGYTLFSVPDQDSSDEEVLNAENGKWMIGLDIVQN